MPHDRLYLVHCLVRGNLAVLQGSNHGPGAQRIALAAVLRPSGNRPGTSPMVDAVHCAALWLLRPHCVSGSPEFVISNAKVTEYGGHSFLLSRSFENSATASWMSFSIERPVASLCRARAESLAFRSRLEIYV